MSSVKLFFFGTLCHAPLREVVLGRSVKGELGEIPNLKAMESACGHLATVTKQAERALNGEVFVDLSKDECARLEHYFDVWGAYPEKIEDGEKALTFYKTANATETPWQSSDWHKVWAGTLTEAAREIMALKGVRTPEEIARRLPQILVHAASRVRAASTGPALVRRKAVPEDVSVEKWVQPYARFFAVEEMDLRFRRFDGSMSEVVNRAIFTSGDAVTVLPYDPSRDRVLLVEQFRAGPYTRGDANPWFLEAIAGRVDAGETPEAAVRREALEEADLELSKLISIAGYYPSPGAKTEYLYSYIGLADLPDSRAGGIGGVADEAEDIRTHLVSYDQLMDLVTTGEAENGPLLISALYLSRLRNELRSVA